MGKITVLAGCMFSGKTTELFKRLERYETGHCLAFKHEIDVRYRLDAVVSHQGAQMPAIRVPAAEDIGGNIRTDTRAVAVDEAHFFGLSLVEAVSAMARRGIDVLLTSLDRDSWGRPFGVAQRLADTADHRILLHARCARCGGIGNRTQRLTPIVNGQMVGGPESYEARCTPCWQPPPEAPSERPDSSGRCIGGINAAALSRRDY